MRNSNRLDGLELIRRIGDLLAQDKVTIAEELLLAARAEALSNNDNRQLELVMTELIALYCIFEPKRYQKAEEVSLEREKLIENASSRLMTAKLLYHSVRNPERSEPKAREAIKLSREQGDLSTLYSSTCLLGMILLRLNRDDEAESLLGDLEDIIYLNDESGSRHFVVGAETSFLESLCERGLAKTRVARIASTLAPISRDVAFTNRLRSLEGMSLKGGDGLAP